MKMKQIEQGDSLSPPPPPPPLPRFWDKKAVPESVTKREIVRFWCQKRVNDEDNLLAAIKAEARIQALKLSEEDYRRFEESLNDDGKCDKDSSSATNDSNNNASDNEVDEKQVRILEPTCHRVLHGSSEKGDFHICSELFPPAPLCPTSVGVF